MLRDLPAVKPKQGQTTDRAAFLDLRKMWAF